MIGTLVQERYRVLSLLGEGAMGRVYLAEHVFMNRKVAIKVLHPELTSVPEYVLRFEREAKAAASIVHPHVAQALDFGRLPDQSLYLVLEHIEGRSLSELVRQGPVEPERAASITLQIADAMVAAHDKHIVHRDLKPENVLLVAGADGGDFVKVLDFGIAKVEVPAEEQARALTQVGRVYGTPGYMAPEQGLGQEVDARADIYALGVVFYELLCGRPPFEGPAAAILGQQLTRSLPFLSQKKPGLEVPAALERIVREMLALDREQRPKGMDVVVARLGALIRDGSLSHSSFEHLSPRPFQPAFEPQRRAPRLPKPSWPVPVKAVGAVTGFVGLGVALSVMIVVGVEHGRPAPLRATKPELVAAPAESGGQREISMGERVALAARLGTRALLELGHRYPAEPLVHTELSLSQARDGRYAEAVDAAQVALTLDPSLCKSPSLRGALFRSAQSVEAADAAFRLLLGPMGEEGAEVLFDLWQGESVSLRTRERAKRLLGSEAGRRLASEAVRVAVELDSARSCKALLQLLDRARISGDTRSLKRIERLSQNETCSRRGEPCYPCLRGTSKVEDARLAIEQRELLRKSEARGSQVP